MLGDLPEGEAFLVLCSSNGMINVALSEFQTDAELEQHTTKQHTSELCVFSSLSNSVALSNVQTFKQFYTQSLQIDLNSIVDRLYSNPDYIYPEKRGPPKYSV